MFSAPKLLLIVGDLDTSGNVLNVQSCHATLFNAGGCQLEVE